MFRIHFTFYLHFVCIAAGDDEAAAAAVAAAADAVDSPATKNGWGPWAHGPIILYNINIILYFPTQGQGQGYIIHILHYFT